MVNPVAKRYLGDLVGGGLLMSESRIVAPSLLQDLSEAEWRHRFEADNGLQKPSRYTSIRYARTIRRRLEPLGGDFIQALIQADEPEYQQMLLLALMLQAPVLTDFMQNVVREQKRLYKTTLSSDAWEVFISDQQAKIPELNTFSPATLKKTGTNVIRILVEGHYLSSNRQRVFQPVYVLAAVRLWLARLGHPELEEIIECTL